MRSLRVREFLAIGVAVVAAVAVTAVVAALLVRRSVKHEALKALVRQTALIAAQERATTSPSQKLTSLGDFFKTQQERLAIISLAQAEALLPGHGATALRAGRPAQGSVDVGKPLPCGAKSSPTDGARTARLYEARRRRSSMTRQSPAIL